MRADIVAKILLILIVVFFLYLIFFENGKACGGLAANLPERKCFPGIYECNYDGSSPDASGTCRLVNFEKFLPSGKVE